MIFVRRPASLCILGFILSGVLFHCSGFSSANARGVEQPVYGEGVVHAGNVIVDGNQTFLVQNCTFTVTGFVTVRDNATLIVKDAVLNVTIFTFTGMVTVSDNGKFIIEGGELNLNQDIDTHIPTPSRICDIDVKDMATMKAVDARIYSKVSGTSIKVGKHGRVTLNSTDTCSGRIEAFDDSDISINESLMSSIKLHGNSSCTVQNTDIDFFSGSDRYAASFYNSTIRFIEFVFGSSSKAYIDSRLMGFHRYWNIHDNFTVDGVDFNLTLHDTNVTDLPILYSSFMFEGIELRILNQNLRWVDCGADSELYLTNSTCDHVICGRHDSVYSIYNSKIGRLSLWDNALVSSSDTEIDELHVSDFKGALICDNVTLLEGLEIDCEPGTRFHFYGGLRFGENFSLIKEPMRKFKAIRGYRVVTRADGGPLANVQLKMHNEEGELIWDGATDGDGEAYFDLTYYRNWTIPPGHRHTNHTDTVSLEASHGRNIYTTELGLITDTPIIFSFPKPKPIWTTLMFWTGLGALTIIAMFATFFYMRRSKPRRTQSEVKNKNLK